MFDKACFDQKVFDWVGLATTAFVEGRQLVVKVVTTSYRIVKAVTAAYRKIKAITLGE